MKVFLLKILYLEPKRNFGMSFADLVKTLFIASSLLNNFSIFLNLSTPSGNNGDKNLPNCTILDI